MVLLKATLYLKPCKHTGDRALKSAALHHGQCGRSLVSSLTLLDPVTLMAALWGAAAM